MKNDKSEAPLNRHRMEVHEGRKIGVEMVIVSVHKKALQRQITEALMIDRCGAQIKINNKSE